MAHVKMRADLRQRRRAVNRLLDVIADPLDEFQLRASFCNQSTLPRLDFKGCASTSG